MKNRKHVGDKTFEICFQIREFLPSGKARLSPLQTKHAVGHDEQSVRRAFLFSRDAGNTLINSISLI